MGIMNDLDSELHKRIHAQMMQQAPDSIFKPRVNTFALAEKIIGQRLSGRVLDVGCGNGYASIWLAKNRPGTQITALEASEAAVRELIPRNVDFHGVGHLVTPKYGSFDDIASDVTYHYVVAFGAIHHSECLFRTMSSISACLADGGYLIANEPAMPNTTTNAAYTRKYDTVQEILGLSIRNGDRHDHFFREAEYIAAAVYAGLDLVSMTQFSAKDLLDVNLRQYVDYVRENGLKRSISRMREKLTGKMPPQSSVKDQQRKRYKELTRDSRSHVMIFKKSDTDYIPHLWDALK